MGQAPVVQGRTRVVAETVAEVVNGFVEVISLRTMVSGAPTGGLMGDTVLRGAID